MAKVISWWQSLPPLLRRLALAVGGLVVLALAFGTFQVSSYTQNDPSFCRSCHTMEKAWQRWSTSEHRNITCHSCHEQSPLESAQLVVQFAMTRPQRVSKHAGISDESCLKCHASGQSRWFQIAATPGHQLHFEKEEIGCVKCHSVSIHRFRPSTQLCRLCHTEERVLVTAMGQRYCLDCHQFLREDSPLRPTRQTCLDCHLRQAQTKVHWPGNAPMRVKCSQCHQPHLSQDPVVNCLSCHQNVPKEGLHQKAPHAASTCQTCHKPHEWEVTKRESCLACHGNKANHNPGILCSNCHGFRK